MKQNLRLFMLTLLCAVFSSAWAQEVTYDFTGSDWSVSNGTLTNGTVSFTGEGKANFKMNSGYFMMGKKDAYINFPTFDFAVGQIEVVGRNGASGSTKMNVFVGDVAVSTETTGCTGTNTYAIATNYQAAETQYTLKVTSDHNAQITAIKIYKVGSEETLTLKTIAEAREQASGEVLTKGVITSLNGNYAYIQDTSAAIYVYGGCGSFAIGDEIEVKGTLTTFNGLMEITNPTCTLKSQNNTVSPEVMTIAQVNASTKQGWLVKIEEATVTAISNKDVTIAQGENTIAVRFNNTDDITFATNDIITLTGNIGCFNTVQISNPRDVTVKENTEPSITVEPSGINLDCNGGEGELTATTNNFEEEPEAFDVHFYEADGVTETSSENFEWVSINTESMTYSVEENTGDARTAYIKISAFDSESSEQIYSNLITINQEGYVDPNLNGWLLTDLANITEDDVFVIVGTNADGSFAMSNDKGTSSAPLAVSVTLSNDKSELTGNVPENIRWNVGVDDSGYIFYPNGDENTWLYATATNNGLRVGTNANKAFTINSDYLYHTGTGRYIGIYNSADWRCYTSINANIKDQEFAFYKKYGEEVLTPSIEVNPSGVNIGADGGDGTITVTYKYFVEDPEPSIKFYEADGVTEQETAPNWITIEFDAENNVVYSIEANTGEARTAYLKVYAIDSESGADILSGLITINQAAFVLDFATIPFYFNGGRNDIENTDGLTQVGLGSDYGSTAPTTHLKFDGTGDWMILKLDEHPSVGPELAFDIKGNSFSDGTFTVQISADGETYEDLATYTELGAVQTEVFNLAENIRYIKWIYTEKVNGNVGLGNIAVIIPEEIVVTFNNRAEGYSTLFYGTKNLIIPDGVKAYTYKVGADGKSVETPYKTYIPKGSAVVVELEDKSQVADAPFDVTFATTAASEPAHTDNMLLGFDEEGSTTVGPDDTKEYLFYSLSLNKNKDKGSIGFYWNKPNGAAFTITAAHRAYLAVEKDVANGASAFAFDGTGTGINGIFANGLPADGVYTLSGVRVSSDRLQKGIYIVNGKKVVIK